MNDILNVVFCLIRDEIAYVRKTALLRAVNLSCYYISSKVIVFLTLLIYVLTGNYLSAEKVRHRQFSKTRHN